MAFKNGLSERLDELRFPSPRSPPSESVFPGYTSLSPGHSNFGSGFSRPSGDVRANLQRRFTTDSSKLTSSWNYLNPGGTTQLPDPLDLLSSFEKKRQHIEYMREQKRRFEEDMKLLDMQHEKEKIEMDQLARDLAKAGLSGPVSEPTTPPEHAEPAVSSVSRPGRFSTSSVTSSPGFFSAFAPSSQLTSPQGPSHSHSSQTNHQPLDRFAGHSMPTSRRNSEKDEFVMESAPFRPGPSLHRYSLPSNNFSSPYRPNASSSGYKTNPGLDSFAATKHLFPSDDHNMDNRKHDDRLDQLDQLDRLNRLSTPDIKSYIKMTEPDDKFPTLSRRDGSNLLSANPDAHDLANARTPVPDSYSFHSRYRNSHQSMPQNLISAMRLEQFASPTKDERGGVAHSRHLARHSLEGALTFSTERTPDVFTPVTNSRPNSLQTSYSTNDLPTVKGSDFDAAITPPKTNAEHLHQHNASMGRIPVGAVTSPFAKGSPETDVIKSSLPAQSILQASAAPFGPQLTSAAANNGMTSPAAPAGVPFPPLYGYGVQPYVAQPTQANSQMATFGQTNNYAPYPAPAYAANNYRFNDAAARGAVTPRRQTESDAGQATRYANHPIDHWKGQLYSLCKDQHGCRYLQRKLEERNPEHVQLIFSEVYMHVIELMTDPFGNYLCQKLLEYSNDEQRTALIDNAAPQLVKIALNQHGTRALQKMIEFISTAEQTQTVINALKYHVVELVQDLNGNHVIQKCLNRLNAEEAEFIYEAVGAHCVVVGTHRHGCCVLQRCIDHASGVQKANLIAQITKNSYALVQDPFGNYVVQYILDLADSRFTTPLCQTFAGNIPSLSKQKFSSNVIEKCLRTADSSARRDMIDEILNGNELDKMLRDSFANYVVQTAMDFADAETCQRLIDAVRPILLSIRSTPHGRRISGKIAALEGRSSAQSSGQVTPNEVPTALQLPKHLTPKQPFPAFHSPSTNGSSSFGFSADGVSPPAPATPSDGTVIYSPSSSANGPNANGHNANGHNANGHNANGHTGGQGGQGHGHGFPPYY